MKTIERSPKVKAFMGRLKSNNSDVPNQLNELKQWSDDRLRPRVFFQSTGETVTENAKGQKLIRRWAKTYRKPQTI